MSKVSLNKLLGEVLQDMGDAQSSVTSQTPLPDVMGDATLLRQILHNLIANAMTYVRENVPPQIQVEASMEEPGRVLLSVKDNGQGIAPEHHTRIFQVFQRLHGDELPGTGIGLAVVKKAAEMMQGSVGVQSELGQGSAFWVSLRAVPAAKQQ